MKLRGLSRVTIRVQVALLSVVVALPLLGAIAYTTYSARENAGDAARRATSQRAVTTAAVVKQYIASARAEMAVIASRPLVRRPAAAHCDPFLREAARLHGRAGLVIENLEGQVVCSTLPVPPAGLPNVAHFEWFQRVRHTGRFTVSEPFLGPGFIRVAVLVLPITDRGRRTGYLTQPIDLVRFQELFARVTAPSQSVVSVVTGSGQIVARSVESERFVGTQLPPALIAQLHEPPKVLRGSDGTERVFASSPIAGTPWFVVLGLPASIAYGASNRLMLIVLILSSALIGLSVLAAILTGRLIARPVRALARRASDIAAGRSDPDTPLEGPHEVVLAGRQLDEMVHALRASEAELRQSQKMEAIGQLAGGIAHDFNNLLTAISGYSEVALSRLAGADPRLSGDIEQIARAGKRAADLTGQLLAFSRRQTLQTSVFDLNDAVSGSESLLRRLLGEHIEILSSLTADGCPVDADRGQVEQILMNLALNARDAMPDGGTLAIETESIQLDEDEARRQFDPPAGRYALLRVSDTGFGMDANTAARAFEPFFTTKPVGQGTGLGLATVFGSVRQNGGSMTVTSEPGLGTTFEIVLPLVAGPVSAPAAASTPARVSGTERILLVEDEEMVRQLVGAFLVGEGYDVLVASDGEEALRISATEPFDLLITDIVMPKLSGKELTLQLRRSRPGLRVVCMSGYAHDAVGGDGLTPGDAFIQKPFSLQALATTVRATLDSAPDDSPTSLLTPA